MNVLHTELAESADSASGFQKRAYQESAYPTCRIGSAEEGLELLAREPVDATLLAFEVGVSPTRRRASAIRCLDWS